jgi:hypothetical protein
MRRIIAAILLLLCMALPCALTAKHRGSADMKGMSHVFVGWVDINSENYHKQGYSTAADYEAVINAANIEFQKACKNQLSGRTITAAKNRDDVNSDGNDLYVKFSDVVYDHHYRLHLSMHFIDAKTNTEIGSVPVETYGAHFCGLVGCLDKELEEVSREMQAELSGGSK